MESEAISYQGNQGLASTMSLSDGIATGEVDLGPPLAEQMTRHPTHAGLSEA